MNKKPKKKITLYRYTTRETISKGVYLYRQTDWCNVEARPYKTYLKETKIIEVEDEG